MVCTCKLCDQTNLVAFVSTQINKEVSFPYGIQSSRIKKDGHLENHIESIM